MRRYSNNTRFTAVERRMVEKLDRKRTTTSVTVVHPDGTDHTFVVVPRPAPQVRVS